MDTSTTLEEQIQALMDSLADTALSAAESRHQSQAGEAHLLYALYRNDGLVGSILRGHGLESSATRLRSERAQRSSKRSAKSCATTPKRSVWMGLPTRRRTCDAVGDAARNRKRHHGRGTRRMGGTQDGQTTAAN